MKEASISNVTGFFRDLMSVFSVTLKSSLLSNQDEFCHDIWRVWKPDPQAFICCTICVDNHGGCWEKWWQSSGYV